MFEDIVGQRGREQKPGNGLPHNHGQSLETRSKQVNWRVSYRKTLSLQEHFLRTFLGVQIQFCNWRWWFGKEAKLQKPGGEANDC